MVHVFGTQSCFSYLMVFELFVRVVSIWSCFYYVFVLLVFFMLSIFVLLSFVLIFGHVFCIVHSVGI